MSEPQNLMEGLLDEMNRVRECIKVYDALPKNAGTFASLVLGAVVKAAEIAIKKGDVIKMLQTYNELKNYE